MRNLNLLTIGLPVAVIIPLLVVSWWIGPNSIYFWAGIGVGMAIINYWIPEPARGDDEQDTKKDTWVSENPEEAHRLLPTNSSGDSQFKHAGQEF